MLESLNIENLILVEKAEIEFGKTLNILTGETGAGKSAILTAIRLLMGEKADPEWIRSGSHLAVIEAMATFDPLLPFCEEEGLHPPSSKLCQIRRELNRSGKSRAFFNGEQISLASLRRLMEAHIEFVDQNSARELCKNSSHRQWLDLWAHLPSFAPNYQEQTLLASECQRIRNEQSSAQELLKRCELDLAEIEEALWRGPQEETELDIEHQKLIASSKVVKELDEIQQELNSVAVVSRLRRLAHRCSNGAAAELFKSAAIEVLEAEKIIDQSLSQQEIDPRRLEQIEERIAVLERLKRRFGDVEKTKIHLQAQIQKLGGLEDRLLQTEQRFEEVCKRNLLQAAERTDERKKAAEQLSFLLTAELKSLNLQQARFEVRVEPKELGPDGADTIHFYFSANAGEPPRLLEECASGGEQSRLLFAFKALFAQKEKRSCVIFDEIDSNVGGQTASILGQKFLAIAQLRQVISITHFIQVAKQADHHFLVSKSSQEGKTKTSIRKLQQEERSQEYVRMIGKSYTERD